MYLESIQFVNQMVKIILEKLYASFFGFILERTLICIVRLCK